MLTEKTLICNNTVIDLMNYKNGIVINIQQQGRERQYKKDQHRRLSTKSFLKLANTIRQYEDRVKEIFLHLEKNHYEKVER